MKRSHVHYGETILTAVTAAAALSMLFIILFAA